MSDEADDIEEQVLADAEAGVQNFSDGTNQVSMAPLKDRLDVVDRIRRNEAASSDHFGFRTKALRGGGAWQ